MFTPALEIARDKGADYACYRSLGTGRTFIDVALGDIAANTTGRAFDLMVAGISAQGKSLYDFDAEQFICGTVTQLID